MKKNKLKIALISVISITVLLYAAFLFVLPNVIDINKYMPDVYKTVKDTTSLNLKLENPKIITGWNFSVGLKADEILVQYKNNADFVKIQKPVVSVQIFPLIFKTVKFNKISAQELSVSLIYTKDEKYTFEEIITTVENSFKAQAQADTNQTDGSKEINDAKNKPLSFKFKNINVIVPKAALNIRDERNNQNAFLNAYDTKINLKNIEGPLQIVTKGDVSISDNKYLTYNIKIKTPLPAQSPQEPQKEEPSEPLKLFNPFENLVKYDLKANADVDLDIKSLSDFKADGYVKINNFSFLSNGIKLPESYFNSLFEGSKITIDSKFYTNPKDNLALQSTVKIGKGFDLTAKTKHIALNDIKNLIYTALSAFGIANDINGVKVNGYLTSDFNLKSDFKKIDSNGLLSVKNGNIIYPKMQLKLTEIASDIDFSDNTITIKNSGAKINNAKISAEGTIKHDSQTDITIKTEPVQIVDLINTALGMHIISNDMIKDYEFKGGTVSLDINAKGKLDSILPEAVVSVNDFAMRVKSAKMPITVKFIDIVAKTLKNDIDCSIKVSNINALVDFPRLNVGIPLLEINANSKDMEIKKTTANAGHSKIDFWGAVKNYSSADMHFDFNAAGAINPQDIIAQIPKNNRSLISYKGQMPLDIKINGTPEAVKLLAKITSNPQNYVSAFEILNFTGKTNVFTANIATKGSNLLLNDISVSSGSSKALSIKGDLSSIFAKNPVINSIQVSVPSTLNVKIPVMKNAKISTSGNLNITGTVAKPILTGNFSFTDMDFPEYKTSIKSANANFTKSKIVADAKGVNVDGSLFDGDLVMSNDFVKTITVNSVAFNSAYIDADRLTKLAASLSSPSPGASSGTSVKAASAAGSAPQIVLKSGVAQIDKLKSGNLIVTGIKSNFSLLNNLLKISDMEAQTCKGNIKGNVSYNLASTLTNLDITAKSVNASDLMKSLMGAKLPLTGLIDASINVSTKGLTQTQQMKNLKGNANVTVQNGEMGSMGRFEHFLFADNLAAQTVMKRAIDALLPSLSSKNTGQFSYLKTKISFNNGYANVNSFETSGVHMSLFANGKYNLLNDNADIKILGRISGDIVRLLGPVADFSVNSVVQNLPTGAILGLSVVQTMLPKADIIASESQANVDKIPVLSSGTNQDSKIFRVLIQGPAQSTRSVKSFRWIDIVK